MYDTDLIINNNIVHLERSITAKQLGIIERREKGISNYRVCQNVLFFFGLPRDFQGTEHLIRITESRL